jgi:Trk-type K+ transport system membrane component
LFGHTIPQKLFRTYIVVIFLGSILLYLPISLQHGYSMVLDNDVNMREYTYWDAMFIAVSALTNTGLTPAVISETLTKFGQVVMIILMEFGGLGLMTIIYLIWNLFRFKNKKSNLNQIIMLQSERGNEKIAGTFNSLKVSVIFILCCQVFFMFMYSF